MTVDVECGRPDDANLAARFQKLLHDRVGIGVEVVLRPQGALAPETGIESRQKPIRLIDLR